MKKIEVGHLFGSRLAKILGVSGPVTSIVIEVKASNAVMVYVTKCLDEGDALCDLLEEHMADNFIEVQTVKDVRVDEERQGERMAMSKFTAQNRLAEYWAEAKPAVREELVEFKDPLPPPQPIDDILWAVAGAVFMIAAGLVLFAIATK